MLRGTLSFSKETQVPPMNSRVLGIKPTPENLVFLNIVRFRTHNSEFYDFALCPILRLIQIFSEFRADQIKHGFYR